MGLNFWALKVKYEKVNITEEQLNGVVREAGVKGYHSDGETIHLLSFKSRESAEEILKRHGLEELVKYVDEDNELWVSMTW